MNTLVDLERIIQKGLSSYIEIGEALQEIRVGKLYQQAGYKTFDAYCPKRWGFSAAHAYRLIRSSRMVRLCSLELGDKVKPSSAQAANMLSLPLELQNRVCAEADFQFESPEMIRQRVVRLIRDNEVITKPASKWTDFTQKVEAIGQGESVTLKPPSGTPLESFRNSITSALRIGSQTKRFNWGTARAGDALVVTKREPLTPPATRLRQRQCVIKREQNKVTDGPREAVGVPSSMCRKCGMVGQHENYPACINALRDRIATLEVQIERLKRAEPNRMQKAAGR